MKKLTPEITPDLLIRGKEYGPPTTTPDGIMLCSAGYTLVWMDQNTLVCTGGSRHTYRADRGDIIKDKFGRLLLRSGVEEE